MNYPDLINSLFEILGSFAIWLSILKLWKDKSVAGVSWIGIAFFTVWGVWNLYYYYDLQQYLSWYAAMLMGISQIIYLYLLIKFTRNPEH